MPTDILLSFPQCSSRCRSGQLNPSCDIASRSRRAGEPTAFRLCPSIQGLKASTSISRSWMGYEYSHQLDNTTRTCVSLLITYRTRTHPLTRIGLHLVKTYPSNGVRTMELIITHGVDYRDRTPLSWTVQSASFHRKTAFQPWWYCHKGATTSLRGNATVYRSS